MSILLTAVWLISFGGLTVEQQYSADSLIGSFTRDAKSPVKGATITFTDVVVETRVDRIVFRSSANDKIICELRAPIAVAAGSPLTVVGRVRGRGALGNVTLDDCSVTAAAAAAIEPLSSPPANVMPEPAPVPIEVPSVQVAEPVNDPLDKKTPVKSSSPVAPRTAAVTRKVVEREAGATSDAVPEPAVVPPSLGPIGTPGIGLAVLGFLVGLLFLPLMKRMPSVLTRGQHHPIPTTPEMRRLALEALLSREQKKVS